MEINTEGERFFMRLSKEEAKKIAKIGIEARKKYNLPGKNKKQYKTILNNKK